MTHRPSHPDDELTLSPEQQMLVQMRDTLYEGSWEDFVHDLRARAENRPHVFETVPTSTDLREKIMRHLTLITEMRDWEEKNGKRLKP